jgi:vanillate/4-hydroxybenzoate decarboxylase subunit D
MRDSEIDRSESESSACPRCSTGDARVVARSPRPGVWTMHLCTVCFYTWRSTEPDYTTRAEVLSPGFRIDPSRLREGRAMPEVPPLRDAE